MFESFYTDSFHISWQQKKTTQTFPMANPVFYFPVRRRDYRKIWSLLFGDGALGGKFRNHRCNKHTWLVGFFVVSLCQLFFFAKQKKTLPNLQQTYAKIIAENVITNLSLQPPSSKSFQRRLLFFCGSSLLFPLFPQPPTWKTTLPGGGQCWPKAGAYWKATCLATSQWKDWIPVWNPSHRHGTWKTRRNALPKHNFPRFQFRQKVHPNLSI